MLLDSNGKDLQGSNTFKNLERIAESQKQLLAQRDANRRARNKLIRRVPKVRPDWRKGF